jgi:hypothetical protein
MAATIAAMSTFTFRKSFDRMISESGIPSSFVGR